MRFLKNTGFILLFVFSLAMVFSHSVQALQVENCFDDGDGSLRKTIKQACQIVGDQVITFDTAYCGGVIQIQSPIVIGGNAGTGCGATSITFVGQTVGSTITATIDGSLLTNNGDCSLRTAVDPLKPLDPFNTITNISNMNFINNSKGPGICVEANAKQVTINNNRIGVTRMFTAAPNVDGIKISGRATVTNNTISQNLKTGISIIGGSKSVISGNTISENNTSNTLGGGVVLMGTSSVENKISNNHIFNNTGLGIDLTEPGFFSPLMRPTLFTDPGDTPNHNIDFADDVIISPIQGNQFNFSANPHAPSGFVFAIEIYEVNAADAADETQKRDGRSYGEGQTLVHSGSVMVDATGRIGINFPGNSGTAYSATLTNGSDTSEFSAIATADATTPVCEGSPLGSNEGTGVKAPAAPSDISFVRNGNSTVVSFTDNAINPAADGFTLERAEGNCGDANLTFTTLKLAFSPKAAGGRKSFDPDTTANVSLNQCYKVSAFRIINSPDGDHAGAVCSSSAASNNLLPDNGNPNTPPVVRIDPPTTQPKDPVVVIITDRSTTEDAFCVERADRPLSVKSCADIPDANYKDLGKITVGIEKTGTGKEFTYEDKTAEAGKLYCYRAKIEVNGNCIAPSAPAEAVKLNPDGSRPEPQTAPEENLTLEGCSLNKSASSRFNLVGLIALLAIAPLFIARALRVRKVQNS